MFQTAIIVFREVLEAALVISIIMAATREIARRGYWVIFGIGGGCLGATLVALAANAIASLFHGTGQEIVNACILFIAVGLIAWHIVWMNKHGRAMSTRLKALGQDVQHGTKHLSILALVVGLTVMREGSEVVLILQGLWVGAPSMTMLGGALLGFVSGATLGITIYFGLVVMPLARIFLLTNLFLTLIAGGMAARGANFLVQADLLPSLTNHVWNLSAYLPDESVVGQFLGALMGYRAQPSGIEVVFYGLTILLVGLPTFLNGSMRASIKIIAIVLILVASGIVLMPTHAKALEVLSPHVTEGEYEFENQGYLSNNANATKSNGDNMVAAAGFTPFSWWKTEVEGEFDRDAGPNQSLRYNTLNWENTFPFTEPGQYWLDPAYFIEIDLGRNSQPNNFMTGLLAEKTIGPLEDTMNVLFHKDFSPSTTRAGWDVSNQTKYRFKPWFEPGIELYSLQSDRVDSRDRFFYAGPGVFGKINTLDGQAIKYQLAYLFATSEDNFNNALRWKLEYEFYF